MLVPYFLSASAKVLSDVIRPSTQGSCMPGVTIKMFISCADIAQKKFRPKF